MIYLDSFILVLIFRFTIDFYLMISCGFHILTYCLFSVSDFLMLSDDFIFGF
ncbi:Uncharacterised protein [Escherichia coli]|uniref:Uncharacterized protein n=1 Tax=Escherichia coli TaxID=562 RepID=A0A485JCA8_ECOLX|nr:Uncharacterised protein [Escherichia coli]